MEWQKCCGKVLSERQRETERQREREREVDLEIAWLAMDTYNPTGLTLNRTARRRHRHGRQAFWPLDLTGQPGCWPGQVIKKPKATTTTANSRSGKRYKKMENYSHID